MGTECKQATTDTANLQIVTVKLSLIIRIKYLSLQINSINLGIIGYTEWGSAVPEIPSVDINQYGLFPSVPWIVYGKGVRKGHQINNPIITYDTGATIAWLLRLKTPQSWRGKPVSEAFQ